MRLFHFRNVSAKASRLTHTLLALAGSLRAAALVGAAVFAATLVYLIDRTGWALGLLLGWAPALLLGLAAAIGHFTIALIVQARWRRDGFTVPEGDVRDSDGLVRVRPLAAGAL